MMGEMPMLKIRICSVDQEEPAFPEYPEATEGKLLGAAVLQGGMESGKTSVGFVLEVDGRIIMTQTSAAILEGLMSAIRGAEQRWEEAQ